MLIKTPGHIGKQQQQQNDRHARHFPFCKGVKYKLFGFLYGYHQKRSKQERLVFSLRFEQH